MNHQGIEHTETIVTGEISLLIVSDYDVITARQRGKWFAEQIGFVGSMPTLLSSLISELARNLLISAKRGKIIIQSVQSGIKQGITVITSEVGQNGKGAVGIKRDPELIRSSQPRVMSTALQGAVAVGLEAGGEQPVIVSSGRGLNEDIMVEYSNYASSKICRMLLARRDLADLVEIIPAMNGTTTVKVTKWL